MTDLDDPTATADGAPTASFVLNGEPVTVRQRHPHLLSALREELDVTSPKDGCSPSGQCGCCTVLVGDKAVVSCQMSLDRIAGGAIPAGAGRWTVPWRDKRKAPATVTVARHWLVVERPLPGHGFSEPAPHPGASVRGRSQG